ncbi:MAG: dephospho-CoA kinase [Eubacteriales bacterium]|nr:dephospho-CoA kinase [Eubacteriales bacterium]
MKVIGITGGVGCGKSEVMKYIRDIPGSTLLLMDDLARELMEKGGSCYEPVLELFGPDILAADGEFDRKAIAALVFADKKLLEKLNAITHPRVKEAVKEQIRQAETDGRTYFFLESALMIEEKYNEICDELWYVYADETVRRERLRSSRGYPEEKITAIMANQQPESVFRKYSSFVIDNSGDLANTKKQIRAHLGMDL